jgi:hypothetical protein
MSDLLLDAVVQVLRDIEAPALSYVTIGRPRSVAQPRTAAVWWGGLADDDTQVHSLSCVGRTERLLIGVYWPDQDAEQVRVAVEYDVRATSLAIADAIHSNITLAGIVDSLWLAETRGDPFTQLSGITYRVAMFELRAMVLIATPVGG